MIICGIINKHLVFKTTSLVGAALLFLVKKVGSLALLKIGNFFRSKAEACVNEKIDNIATNIYGYFYPTEAKDPESQVASFVEGLKPVTKPTISKETAEEQFQRILGIFIMKQQETRP